MPLWQQLMLGLIGVMLIFFLWPGVKAQMERSKEVENPDWLGALLPIGFVVLFIMALIYLVKS